jgi:hypothetical protein
MLGGVSQPRLKSRDRLYPVSGLGFGAPLGLQIKTDDIGYAAPLEVADPPLTH